MLGAENILHATSLHSLRLFLKNWFLNMINNLITVLALNKNKLLLMYI